MSTAAKSEQLTQKKWNPRSAIVANAAFFLVFIGIALLVMRKWNSPDPWSAVDANVIAILVLSVIYGVQQLILYPSVFKTRESMDLFVGKRFDRRMPAYLGILGALELLGFADYAHWNLVPVLRNPVLQAVGLGIMFGGLLWLFYVDRYMSKHFLEAWRQHELMTGGPYRWMRHPRYLALLLSRVGFTLAIASVLVWVLLAGWFVAVWLRMTREEGYLLGEFGSAYMEFMRTHARLIPGVY